MGNVPHLRFPEFSGEWKKCKFGDIATGFDYGMNAAAKPFDGENKYIRITDIDEASSQYLYDDVVSPDGELGDSYLVKENDILLARTGASTGKSYLYRNSDGKLYFAGFLIRANIYKHNSYFVFSQLHTHRYKKWISVMSARSGQPGINSQEYASFPLYTTSLQEEDKIASFLKLLDERIATQNKIIEDLKKLKSAITDLLFHSIADAHTIRLGEIAHITNGAGDVQDANTEHQEDWYPFFDRSEELKWFPTYSFDKEAVIYAGEGQSFYPRYYNGKFALHQRCYAIMDFASCIIPKYCYHFMNTLNSYFVRNSVGSTVPSLRMDIFQKVEIRLPPIPKQQHICKIIDAFYTKLEVEQRGISILQELKQFLLSQMFI
ncbi:restriction endonuclease subunit S [Bacteroides fragilis]|mgnify:FL=1